MVGISPEREKFLVPIPPQDIAGGVSGDIFKMGGHAKLQLVVAIGVSESAFTKILVNECEDAAGTGRTAIAFAVYKEETAAGDTLGARTAVTAAGLTPSANDNIFYVIDIDARELSDGSQWVEIELQASSIPNQAAVFAVLSGSRFGNDQNATVLA